MSANLPSHSSSRTWADLAARMHAAPPGDHAARRLRVHAHVGGAVGDVRSHSFSCRTQPTGMTRARSVVSNAAHA